MSRESSHNAIREFWRWFLAHRREFDALTEPATPFWDVALSHLQRLETRLRFELSAPDATGRELIITAEGHAEVFPLVEAAVANAPRIPGWRFIALKPPMGFDFTTTYESVRFVPRDMWFIPLAGRSRPRDLGLRVGVPDFTPTIGREARNAVAIILDTALGERAAALDIQHFEVSELPESPESEGYMELHELPRYIEWRKRRQRTN